ncbi:MAG: glycerol-3-phosphate 1-O-acyltransferase PlsY [Bacteroidetes bacterium]|nr:glycerol-3-phosphate 1-O-acyltransferase PlsY [Bacteroidota bacterium]HET6243676.1 glycerol-3-phosphate 1-O-acyltransferase PlsY [Bacteroidia bacterium]
MEIYEYIAIIMLAYLLGALSPAVWIGKIFYNIDVRKHGSSSSGATNTFRVLGKKAGIPVLIIDVLKGSLAVLLAEVFYSSAKGSDAFLIFQLLLGTAAVLGHIFPVYTGFKGGKGVATLLGIMIVIEPIAAGLTVLIFLVVLYFSKFVSLSSIIGALFFPLITIFIFGVISPAFIVFSLGVFFLVLLTHKENLKRLANKTESKTNLFG